MNWLFRQARRGLIPLALCLSTTGRSSRKLRIATEDYGLPGVHGGCDKDNIASRRAMEKGGMIQYGAEDNGDPLFRFIATEKD